MIYLATTCLQCGQPLGQCICHQRFRALVDLKTAAQRIAAYIEAVAEDEEEGDLANLLLQVNHLAQEHEYVSVLSLCYDVGSENGLGWPYVEDLEWALEALVGLGQITQVGPERYQTVSGAPVLAIAG
jgi:hypothetical protein